MKASWNANKVKISDYAFHESLMECEQGKKLAITRSMKASWNANKVKIGDYAFHESLMECEQG
jgi:hypothetical protein